MVAATSAAPKRIEFLGDSITFGAGAPGTGNSTPKYRWCYPGQLRTLLTPAYGDAGTGWVLLNRALWPPTTANQGWDPRIVFAGGLTSIVGGPFNHACFRIPAGGPKPSSYIEFTAVGSSFSTLVLADAAGTSRQRVSVDGAPPRTLTSIAPDGPRSPVQTDVATGADGEHTIRIWGDSGPVDLVAVQARTGTGRFLIDTIALSGESLAGFAYTLGYVDAFAADLLVVALGTNDYNGGQPLDAVRRNLTAIIDRQQATGRDVALSFPPVSAPIHYPGPPAPTYTDYARLYATIALERDVPFLDLTHLWGPTFEAADRVQPQKYADHSIHPSDDGARDMAEQFRAFLAL